MLLGLFVAILSVASAVLDDSNKKKHPKKKTHDKKHHLSKRQFFYDEYYPGAYSGYYPGYYRPYFGYRPFWGGRWGRFWPREEQEAGDIQTEEEPKSERLRQRSWSHGGYYPRYRWGWGHRPWGRRFGHFYPREEVEQKNDRLTPRHFGFYGHGFGFGFHHPYYSYNPYYYGGGFGPYSYYRPWGFGFGRRFWPRHAGHDQPYGAPVEDTPKQPQVMNETPIADNCSSHKQYEAPVPPVESIKSSIPLAEKEFPKVQESANVPQIKELYQAPAKKC